MLGGDVLLPGLSVGEIHRVVVAVGVFVGKSAEAVAELVDNHWAELLVLGGGECVAVIDAAAAVFRGIYQHDDVLVGHCHEVVVQLLEVESGEVAVAVEGVEMRRKGGVYPFAVARLARAALLRGRLHGDDVEIVLVFLEGGMTEERIYGYAGVVDEGGHLVGGVALRHEGYVDAVGCVLCRMEHGVGVDGT